MNKSCTFPVWQRRLPYMANATHLSPSSIMRCVMEWYSNSALTPSGVCDRISHQSKISRSITISTNATLCSLKLFCALHSYRRTAKGENKEYSLLISFVFLSANVWGDGIGHGISKTLQVMIQATTLKNLRDCIGIVTLVMPLPPSSPSSLNEHRIH